MSDVCPVPSCDRPRPRDAHLCRTCATGLADDLAALGSLAGDLETALARQNAFATAGRTAPRGLPYDPRAGDALAALHTLLEGWARALHRGLAPVAGPICARCHHRSCARITATRAAAVPPRPDTAHPAGDGRRTASIPTLAAWLHARHRLLARHPDAARAATELHDARRTAEKAVDRPPARWYAGPCDCGEPMYVQPGAATATCPRCESAHDAHARREWLLDSIADRLTTAAQAAQIITLLSARLPADRIRKWAQRGLLQPRGRDAADRALYRVSDVMDLHTAMLIREAQRSAAREERKLHA